MGKQQLVAEPGKQEIVITRTFEAPRELVFRALIDPDWVAQWWGPRRYTTTIVKLDAKAGGMWRFVQKGADGNEFGFHGVYHDVVAPERVVYTFEFEGMPGHVLMETIRLEEVNGKTTMIDTAVFQSVEDRDGMLMSGMEDGATESMDRLEELLAAQRARV
jgi:uncharacterized protein YndB with AHSA1/START domain